MYTACHRLHIGSFEDGFVDGVAHLSMELSMLPFGYFRRAMSCNDRAIFRYTIELEDGSSMSMKPSSVLQMPNERGFFLDTSERTDGTTSSTDGKVLYDEE